MMAMRAQFWILLVGICLNQLRCMRFTTIGDFGMPHAKIAKGMQQYLSENGGVDTIFGLGDNFYENGVQSIDDKQWKTVFEDVYIDPSVQVPWYNVLGNHDYYGNPQAQIDYTTERNPSGKWNMPSNYYTKRFDLCSGDSLNDSAVAREDCGTAQAVFIDTVLLNPEEDDDVHDSLKLYEGKHLNSKAKAQLDWMEQVFQTTTADWLFVVGHYPLYSVGANGNDKKLQHDLKPMFEKYEVDAYFCGHDHILSHLAEGDVQYYVVGAAAKLESKFHHKHSYDREQLIWAELEYGFTVHELTKDSMTVKFVNEKQEEIHTYTQLPRRTMPALMRAANVEAAQKSWIGSSPISTPISVFLAIMGVTGMAALLVYRKKVSKNTLLKNIRSLFMMKSAERKSLLRRSTQANLTQMSCNSGTII